MKIGCKFSSDQRSRLSLAAFALWWVLLLLVLGWAYKPGFDGPFYMDSVHHIQNMPRYHVTQLNAEQLENSMRRTPDGPLYRPVSSLSFGLNYFFLGGEPAGFRVVNVVIHALASLALVFLLCSLLKIPSIRKAHPFVAENGDLIVVLAATFWALHPIQTSAVTYIIQRMAMLAALFIFVAVGCFIRARLAKGAKSAFWWSATLLAIFLGVFSKANGTLSIPLCVLAELLFFAKWQARAYRQTIVVALCAISALAATMFFKIGFKLIEQYGQILATRDYTLMERVLTQARLQLWYLFLLLFPDPRLLNFDVDVVLSTGLFSPPQTAVALAIIASLVAVAVKVGKRMPLVTFGVFWFLGAQILESTIIPLELYFEHRMYAPSVFVFFAVSLALVGLFVYLKKRRSPVASLVVAASIALAAVMAGGTHARNVLWGDLMLFAQDNYSKSPDKLRNISRLSKALVVRGDKAEDGQQKADLYLKALAYAKLAAEKAPEDTKSRHNLAMAYLRIGERDKFEEMFDRLAELKPERLSIRLVTALAHYLVQKGEMERALLFAQSAAERAPHIAYSQVVLALVFANSGEEAKARQYFLRALALDEKQANWWYALGVVQIRIGDKEEARRSFERAASIEPDNQLYMNALKARDGLDELPREKQ